MSEEQFADALDGIVNGKTPADSDPLASFARQIHDQEGERMPDERRSAIWRGLMTAQPQETPTTGGAGPLSQPTLTEPTAFNPWVGRALQPEPKRMGVINDGFQVSITALAVVAIIIAAFAAFPIIRGDRGPAITPTAFAAAPTSVVGMLSASESSPDPEPTLTQPSLVSTPWATWWPNVPAPIDPAPSRPVPAASPWPFQPPTMAPMPAETWTTPEVTYHHPQAADCTVEPLTVDEVMAILEGESYGRGGPNGELRTRKPMDEETHKALAEAQREWIACRIFGSPFQTWALESDQMIVADFQRMYFPMYSTEGIRDTLAQMQAESGDSGWNSSFTWDPPKDTYIPMVPDYAASSGDAVYGNGSATLTVVWTNRNGVMIREGQTGVPALEKNLPNVWTFFWDEASGQWLLDGYGGR